MSSQNADNKKYMADPISGKIMLEENSNDIRVKMEVLILTIQREFCKVLEEYEEDKKFHVDKWNQPECRGGGITCVMEDGKTFEKASINVSAIYDVLSPVMYQLMRRNEFSYSDKLEFFTAGITAFVHPKNPHIPSLHFSYRYFEANPNNDEKDWWFGGGIQMTPYILNEKDCCHFHQVLKSCCDKHNESFYSCYKKQCDEYFYLPHRAESLGIGGIFFENLNAPSQDSCFNFVSAIANCAIPCYIPIIETNMEKKFSQDDRQWQYLRRGRYAEFDLLCDKASKWSLVMPGVRCEDILLCMPPDAKWQYSHSPEEGSKEWKLLDVLKTPRDWV